MVSSNAGRSRHLSKRAPPRTTRTRKFDSAWELFAPAKLNLYLEVLGLRTDGYRSLETFMVPVRIYDQLLWQQGTPATLPAFSASGSSDLGSADSGSLTLRVHNLDTGRLGAASVESPSSRDDVGPDAAQELLLGEADDNLVLRAARLLARTAGIAPQGRFDLVKRIPIQAGMGGGSSDAAATLLLANDAWGLGYSRQQLLPIAAQLGSDVPFCLGGGAAICRGRGELIEPIARLPRLHFVIVKPAVGLSTPEVFQQLPEQVETEDALATRSHSRVSQLVDKLQSGQIAAAGQLMSNRLEIAAAPLAPWLARLRDAFVKLGCLGHCMTGSGSAYVGLMRSAKHAQYAVRRIVATNIQTGLELGNVFATSSC